MTKGVKMRGLLAAILILSWTAAPASAEGERTLLDVTIKTRPKAADGLCLYLDTGTVLASVELAGDHTWPVYYNLSTESSVRQNSLATIKEGDPYMHTMTVTGGVYCLTLVNASVPPERQIQPHEADLFTQMVAVRVVWFPPR